MTLLVRRAKTMRVQGIDGVETKRQYCLVQLNHHVDSVDNIQGVPKKTGFSDQQAVDGRGHQKWAHLTTSPKSDLSLDITTALTVHW